MNEIRFTVYARPQPQGSTNAFIPKGWDRPVITTDNSKLKPYRQAVAGVALTTMSGQPMIPRGVAVSVTCDFYFAKPPSIPKRRTFPTVKPDGDKLLRATWDAMTGIVYEDDSQIVKWLGGKHYGLPERVEIVVAIVQEIEAPLRQSGAQEPTP